MFYTKKERNQKKKSNLLNAEALDVTKQFSVEESDSLILNRRRGESDKYPEDKKKIHKNKIEKERYERQSGR